MKLWLVIILIFLTGCGEIFREMIAQSIIEDNAARNGKFPRCPSERPYRLGSILLGPCVDKTTLDEYINMKSEGSTKDEEKEFIVRQEALLLGTTEACPIDRPFAVHRFFMFGTACLTEEEFRDFKDEDVLAWKAEETIENKARFIANSRFCESGFLYDSHDEVCINPNDCTKYPMMQFNMQTGLCDCMEGAVKAEVGCTPEQKYRSCEYDSDCGKPYCIRTSKSIPRCNTRTYTCWTESVECKDYFGKDATCEEGICHE